jgi:hypothetical protein
MFARHNASAAFAFAVVDMNKCTMHRHFIDLREGTGVCGVQILYTHTQRENISWYLDNALILNGRIKPWPSSY